LLRCRATSAAWIMAVVIGRGSAGGGPEVWALTEVRRPGTPPPLPWPRWGMGGGRCGGGTSVCTVEKGEGRL